ncbi:MAG: hypothetical protein AVDCRST_MAG70-1420, partial [uncultured Thermomicrobiales bacterium]
EQPTDGGRTSGPDPTGPPGAGRLRPAHPRPPAGFSPPRCPAQPRPAGLLTVAGGDPVGCGGPLRDLGARGGQSGAGDFGLRAARGLGHLL